jgi:hypothetical protein
LPRRHLLPLALTLVCLAAAPSEADEPRLGGDVGGGVTFPLGATSDRFKPGWQLRLGASWRLDERLALRLGGAYGRHRVVGESLGSGFVHGRHSLLHLDLGLQLTLNPRDRGRFYLFAGPSLVRRRTEILDVAGYRPGPALCDSWLMVCVPPGAALRDVLGARTSTRAGLVAGGGVEVSLWHDTRFCVESSWLLVLGPSVGEPGVTRESNAVYLPLTFGLRF